MAEVLNIFQATPPEPPKSSFDLDKLTQQFHSHRTTDWSPAESFLALILAAASADGHVSREEQAEIQALAYRSRALKNLTQAQLAAANTVVGERLKTRADGLREACESLPADMRISAFAHCVDIILADGTLQPVEADFLNRLTTYLAIDAADAKRVVEVLLAKNRY